MPFDLGGLDDRRDSGPGAFDLVRTAGTEVLLHDSHEILEEALDFHISGVGSALQSVPEFGRTPKPDLDYFIFRISHVNLRGKFAT